jgi:hypothetical protein
MSTKSAFFGVDREYPVEAIANAVREVLDVLDEPPDEVFAWVLSDADLRAVRWFAVLGVPARTYVLDAVVESLAIALDELIVALHDDQNGVFLFERWERSVGDAYSSRRLGVMSDGPAVFYDGCAPGGIVRDEKRNAIDAGMAVIAPNEAPRNYLRVLSAPTVIRVSRNGRACESVVETGDRSRHARLVQFFPNDEHWSLAKIPMRNY